MKRIGLSLLLLLLLAALAPLAGCNGKGKENEAEPKEETTMETEKQKSIDVVILAGQSNAVGVGHAAYLPRHFGGDELKRFRKGYEDITIRYYSHNHENAGFDPVTLGCAEANRDTFGPEVGMADYFSQRYPDRKVVIVKFAVGSTSLHHDWASPEDRYVTAEDGTLTRPVGGDFNREAGWCLDGLYALLHESLSALEADGYEPTVRGFCWMQGENDAITEEHTAAYPDRFRRMLASFEAEFAPYLTDCVYVDGGISTIWKNYREINEFKQTYAAEGDNRVYIDTIAEGLTTKNEPDGAPDIYHYDSDSVIKLGRLFAAAIDLSA